jgi:phosphate transport system substrate-binding protein
MTLLRKCLYLTLAALFVASCGGAGPAAKPTPDPLAGTYTTKGGGGALDAVKALTSGFTAAHPTVTWQGFDDVGSDAGVSLTVSSTVDLGFISRALRDAEKGTVETVSIGVSGTGVGVNATNTVKALTKDQVKKIFAGEITNWKDVGGADTKIRVLLREPESSTRTAFETYFFGSAKPVYAKDAIEVFQIDETLKALGSFKDSIGMMTMNAKAFSAAGEVRMLTIDNIAATKDTLVNLTYPIRRPLFFVYHPEPAKVKPTIKAFIDFVKGPEGQKILAGL